MSLEHYEGKNSGGIKQLYLIKKSLATFPYPPALDTSDLDYSEDITTTENWLQVIPLPNSARWEEVESEDEGGNPVYSYICDFVINKDRRAVTEELADKVRNKLLCLMEDNNDNDIRLLGSDEHFCTLTYSQVKERGVVQPNLYRVRITCTMGHAAVYYSGDYTGS